MQIHIGNLSVMTTANQLASLFLPFGPVASSKILGSGRKGPSARIGLIEMDNGCGKKAISRLHRLLFMNCYIEVEEVLA